MSPLSCRCSILPSTSFQLIDRVASICFVQSAIAMVIILIAAEAHALVPLTAGFVLMGWGVGGAIPLQETIWASYFGRRYIGAVRSAALPVALFLGAGAPLAVSAYYDAVGNYRGIFFFIAGLWVVAAVLSTFVRRPSPPVRPPAEAAASRT